jgi:outer membrane receptor protein involved in Fe transport
MFRTSLKHVCEVFVFLAICIGLAAQTPAIGISGTVTDGTGGAVPGAKITATNQATSASQSVLADAAGQFAFPALPAGTYTVQTEYPGFSAYVKKDVVSPAVLQISVTPSANTTSVDVSEKIDRFDVVPSAPTNTVFGLDTPLPEIPRSISVVPSEMMTRYDIKTVNDLVAASPGSFTGSYFGIPGSLFIRGEAGDNFFRGFRRVENRGNYETPVGDAEELEIVKGPPSPVYGGGKVGGYLNYTPKSARSTTAKWLEHPTGKITMTYGSYDQKLGSGEFGSPFKLGKYRGGFYAFFSAQDSKSFYKGIATRDKLGNVAFDMELPSKWRLEAGMQGFTGSLPQNIGWNRVTQQLIDTGTYQAGTPMVNLAGGSYNLNPANFQAGQLLNFA